MKKIVVLLLMLPLAVWAQDEEVRKKCEVIFPNQMMCASNEKGWTACFTEGTEEVQCQIFDEHWEELYTESWKSKYGPEYVDRLTEKDRYIFSDDHRFGFVHMRPDVLLRYYIIDLKTKERRSISFSILPDTEKARTVEVIGRYSQNGSFNILWLNKKGNVSQTQIDLNGKVSYRTFQNDSVRIRYKPNFIIHFAGQNGRLPSDPMSGLGESKLFAKGDTIWLLSHVHLKKTFPADQLTVSYLDMKNGTFDAFYLPVKGNSFIEGNALWSLDINYMSGLIASFKVKRYDLHTLVQSRNQAQPSYDSTITNSTNPRFPLPYISRERITHKKKHDAYVSQGSAVDEQATSTDMICRFLNSASNIPFLVVYDQNGLHQIQLGVIQSSVTYNAFLSTTTVKEGQWMKIMKLCFDLEKGNFTMPDSVYKTTWERLQEVKIEVKETTGKAIWNLCTFQRPDGWYAAFYEKKTEELVFQKL
ncbi:MAG: hypothetical protein AB8F95_12595 [Bacteroidia bacterium]